MSNEDSSPMYSVEQAVRAQRALRQAAGMGEEMFPLEAFVGMISDEIETLRRQGKSDADIAGMIESNSEVRISSSDITRNYAPPEQRHREG